MTLFLPLLWLRVVGNSGFADGVGWGNENREGQLLEYCYQGHGESRFAQCCGRNPTSLECTDVMNLCRRQYEYDRSYPSLCRKMCGEMRSSWCPGGLPTYAITLICLFMVAIVAGIVITVICCIRKRRKQAKKAKKALKQAEKEREREMEGSHVVVLRARPAVPPPYAYYQAAPGYMTGGPPPGYGTDPAYGAPQSYTSGADYAADGMYPG
jgi:hypothetical protein